VRALLIVVALASIAHAEPRRVIVVVDRSAAMAGDRLDLAKTALVDLVDTLDSGDRIAIVGVSKTASVIAPFAIPDREKVGKALEGLRSEATSLDLGRGIEIALSLVRDGKPAHVVVIAAAEPAIDAGVWFARAHAKHVTVATVAVQQASTHALDALAARGKGRAFSVDDLVDFPHVIATAATPPAAHTPRAIVFVIDDSSSMRGPRLDGAKAATRIALDKLAPDDEVGVVVFDSDATVVHPLLPLTRPAFVAAQLDRVDGGGGTNIFTGLKVANELLAPARGVTKHVVLFTDGEAPIDGIAELCQDMRAGGITIDAIGLQGSDRNVLAMIAETGDGRLFMVEDVLALPHLFELAAGSP
jgi:Mg-chelatase subunit ChlD